VVYRGQNHCVPTTTTITRDDNNVVAVVQANGGRYCYFYFTNLDSGRGSIAIGRPMASPVRRTRRLVVGQSHSDPGLSLVLLSNVAPDPSGRSSLLIPLCANDGYNISEVMSVP
jgi:hypothetical protein